MQRQRIKEVLETGKPEQSIFTAGWVRTKRVSKNFAFIVINDGSTQNTLQVIVDQGTPAFDQLQEIGTGAAVKVEGVVKESPGKGQNIEVHCVELEVVGTSPQDYPLQKKGHTLEFLREIGHLRTRTNTLGAVFRVRNALSYGVHQFFQERGFMWAHTPILTASDCEGAGEMFGVNGSEKFFGKEARLTVSGQLEAEILAMSHGNVYTFGPTFRAENSNTSRHLSEFWMIEPEMAFADLADNADLAADFLKAMCKVVVDKCPDELEFFAKMYKSMTIEEIQKMSEASFARISYTDAVKELEGSSKKFEYPVKWGIDLQSEHERFLTDEVFKGPVIVTDYPITIKPFYMRVNDDEKTVAAMDVLAPRIGEIIGGSQREERLPILERRMDELDVPKEELSWYLDLRRYGSVPHSGFGLGFERLVQYLTGMGNIRDVILCPRAPGLI